MKIWVKRISTSFAISVMCGLVVNMLVEMFVRAVTGLQVFPMVSEEFTALFPSKSIATEVNLLLYGVIGAAFSAAAFIYEQDKIGFLLQNLLYVVMTGSVWIPIVCLLWQLQKNPPAFISAVCGFVATYLVMTVVGYRITKREVDGINRMLEIQENRMHSEVG